MQKRDAVINGSSDSGIATDREFVARCKDGTSIPVEIRLNRLETEDGVLILAAVRDVTERKKVEETLRKSEERFDLTVRGSGDGLWDYDPATGELWFADRFRELLGYSSEEDYPMYRAYTEGTAHTVDDDVLWRKDGTSLDAEYTSVPIRRDGAIIGAVVFFRNITERKQAQAQLQKLSSAVEQSPCSAVITDVEGCIEYVNPKFTEVTGYTREESVGENPRVLKSGKHQPEFYEDLWKTITSGQEWHGVFCNRKKSGELYWESASISPIRSANGNPAYYVAVQEDVTERKHAEQALVEARRAAEAATQAKSDFRANMSHEIRTPMNGIIGMTDLALDTDLTPEQRDYLGMVKMSADALLSLINDILDFSKIEAGKLELEPIDFALRDALADMLNTLANRAYTKGLELIYEVSPDVHDALIGDVYRLQQIVVNLVGNAIKFTERGEVVVSVAPVDRTDKNTTLHFTVRDTGIGIPADKVEAVFRPFEQADASTTRQFGGTGLGLAISIQLVEMTGGRIWAESLVGRGSIFHFTAVFGWGEAVPATDAQESQEMLEGLPFLVVDDNATNRRILDQMLKNWPMAPRTVEDGAAALAARDRSANVGNPFRLVPSDVNMPRMDCFTLFESTRSNARHQSVPFILLTSAARPGDVARCREIGVAAHLIKPVSRQTLFYFRKLRECWEAIDAAPFMPRDRRPLCRMHSTKRT